METLGTNMRVDGRADVAPGTTAVETRDDHASMATPKALKDAADSPSNAAARPQAVKSLGDKGAFAQVVALTDDITVEEMTPPIAVARARALRALGETEAVLALAEAHLASHPPSSALIEVAVEAAGVAAEWPRALWILDAAIARSNETRLHFRRAIVLFHMDEIAESLDWMLRVSGEAEFRLRANLFLVKIFQRLEDADRIVATCQDILAMDPENEFAHETLIKQFIASDDPALAREAFDRAAAARPDQFPEAVFDFLTLGNVRRRRKALKPFEDPSLRAALSPDLKARIGNAFYISGKFGHARSYANLLGDDEHGRLLRARIAFATGQPIDVATLPGGRDGDLARALHHYMYGNFQACVAALEKMDVEPQVRLAMNNFRDLAMSRRSLSPELYAPASNAPPGGDSGLPVIRQLWVGAELSRIERLSIRSFIACGHVVHLYTYSPDLDVPDGCVVHDADDILPQSEIFVHSSKAGRSKGSLAGFADRFRWKLLYEKGGAWADADVICLKPIDSRTIISTELIQVRGQILPAITNCFFACDVGEPALADAFEEVSAADGSRLRWGEIGIHKMAELVARNGWGDRLVTSTDICPIPPFQIVDAIMGDIDVETIIQKTGCRAVHLYNEVIRTSSIDKNGTFPANGALSVLERKVVENEKKLLN